MAKRITASAIKWKELEQRVPPEQRGSFYAFKGKSEAYLRRMLSNPPDPPKINWEQYKKLLPEPGLVDKFHSAYTSFKVPYPQDKLTALVEKQWKDLQPEIEKFRAGNQKHIVAAEKEIARINALPKYEDMTMEMVYDLFPDCAMDFVKKPSFWPHTEDEQLGYVDPTSVKKK